MCTAFLRFKRKKKRRQMAMAQCQTNNHFHYKIVKIARPTQVLLFLLLNCHLILDFLISHFIAIYLFAAYFRLTPLPRHFSFSALSALTHRPLLYRPHPPFFFLHLILPLSASFLPRSLPYSTSSVPLSSNSLARSMCATLPIRFHFYFLANRCAKMLT